MEAREIEKLEAAGAKRWSKYGKDRLYIDAKVLGLELTYYKTGNVSSAKWQGESISNADGRRLNNTKVYVDVADGSLHVSTDYWSADDDALDKVAERFVEAALAETEEEEETEEETEETNPLTTASTLDEAYDVLVAESVAWRGKDGRVEHLSALMDEIKRRFAVGTYEDIAQAVMPRLQKALGME